MSRTRASAPIHLQRRASSVSNCGLASRTRGPRLHAKESSVTRRHLGIEIAGLLAGRVWAGEVGTLVLVEEALPADQHVERSSVHVTFRPEAWDVLSRELDRRSPETVVVGWYHSHPSLGAFFSGTDRQTQRGAFRADWQIGVVVDPHRDEIAAFRGPEARTVDPADFVSNIRLELPGTATPEAATWARVSRPVSPRRPRRRRLGVLLLLGLAIVALVKLPRWRRGGRL